MPSSALKKKNRFASAWGASTRQTAHRGFWLSGLLAGFFCLGGGAILVPFLYLVFFFFFFNDTATTEIYTLSLHDALPISRLNSSTLHLVCRLLLEFRR